jgi:hypothetical protein
LAVASTAGSSLKKLSRDLERVPKQVARDSVRAIAKVARSKRGSAFSHGRYTLAVRTKVEGNVGIVDGGGTRGFWAIKNAGQERSYAGFARKSGDGRWTKVREFAEDEAPKITQNAVRAVMR